MSMQNALGDHQPFVKSGSQWLVVKNTFLHLAGHDDDAEEDGDHNSPTGRRSSIPSSFRWCQPTVDEDAKRVASEAEEIEHSLDRRTTVMLRNLPEGFSHQMLEAFLDQEGFAACYDFLYLPADICTGKAFLYAFVNLITPEAARRFHRHFTGFCNWPLPSSMQAMVEWSEVNQGLDQMVDRYRNSPMMHPLVPDNLRPALYSNGARVAFPAPTKPIPAPRLRRSKDGRSRRLEV